MKVIAAFGSGIEKRYKESPEKARRFMIKGWHVLKFKFRHFPHKEFLSAEGYLAEMMMDNMIKCAENPEKSAAVSIFTPCDLLHEAGLYTYSAEGLSCFLSGSGIEEMCIKYAENNRVSETLCSYHKTFIGAVECGLVPLPEYIVYTSLICDANMVTFKMLSEKYSIPSFFIDVPMEQSEESVQYVAGQLRKLKVFLEEHTGKTISEENLKKRIEKSASSVDKLKELKRLRKDRYIPMDVLSPMYWALNNNLLSGTDEQKTYLELAVNDAKNAENKKGTHLYFMHTVPFWSTSLQNLVQLKEGAQIVGCDLGDCLDFDFLRDDPYESMAVRMVYNTFNGNVFRRIEAGVKHAKETGADGVVWFCHWGCKRTLGSANLAKKIFEENGLPLLILDGDGCDKRHGGEGQTATRLGAFIEMLEKRGDKK